MKLVRRGYFLAALAAVIALALPAGSAAAPPIERATSATLFTTPFTARGYSWSMIVGNGSLTIVGTKRRAGSSQTHMYTFQQGVELTASSSLSTATLSADLGRYGKIAMTFTGRGKLARSSAPRPCTGPGFVSKSGTLAGEPGFSLVADGPFFGAIDRASLGARLSRQADPGTLDCSSVGGLGKPPAGSVTLLGSRAAGDRLTVVATKSPGGAVTESATLIQDRASTAPATVKHTVSARAPSPAFTYADDLTSAAVHGVGPFLSGTLSFTAARASGDSAAGELTGDFTVEFGSPAAQTPAAAGLDGTLVRRT
jgi:hypothetical protein